MEVSSVSLVALGANSSNNKLVKQCPAKGKMGLWSYMIYLDGLKIVSKYSPFPSPRLVFYLLEISGISSLGGGVVLPFGNFLGVL